jgi:AcrR family transcriptional regulator
MTETRKRPGRRLDPALDKAIQAAVVEVLAMDGYGGLTMEAVAVVAHVSKATIYRRWPTKTNLLVSVIDGASDDTLTVLDTGSLRGDLVALLTALVDVLCGPGGTASRALLSAATAEPAMTAAFREGPIARWGAAFAAAFQRAADRGEITPEAATSHAVEAGPSILLSRWSITGEDIDAELAEAIVDEVMLPLLQGYRARR